MKIFDKDCLDCLIEQKDAMKSLTIIIGLHNGLEKDCSKLIRFYIKNINKLSV